MYAQGINQSFVGFRVVAADLNLVDTIDKTLATLGENQNLVYVPRRLELFKEAGTAYTLTPSVMPSVGGEVALDRFDEDASPRISSYADAFGGDRMLTFSMGYRKDSTGVAGVGRPFFYIPAVGFLDSADAKQLVAFSVIDGGIFKPGRFSLVMSAGIGIASGTGDLYGRMFFDTYPVLSSGFFSA